MGTFNIHAGGAGRILLIFAICIACTFMMPQKALADDDIYPEVNGGESKATAATLSSLGDWFKEAEQVEDTQADWEDRWYKFSVPDSGRIRITVRNYDDPVNYTVTDGAKWTSMRFDPGIDEDNFITFDVTKGTYYIHFTRPDTSLFVNFKVKASFVTAGESFSPSKDSASDLVSEAKKQSHIGFKKRYVGWLAVNDSSDCYRINMKSSGRLRMDLTNDDMRELDLELYDGYGNKVYYETLSVTKGVTRNIDLLKGYYYLKFCRSSLYDTGKYTFKAYFESADETRTETVTSTNNTLAKAKARAALRFAKSYRAMFAANDSIDIYRINVTRAGNLLLGMNSAIGTMKVRLLDSSGNRVPGYLTFREGKSAIAYSVKKGTHYVSFERSPYSNTGVFLFKVFQQPLPTKVVAKKRLKKAVRIRWKPVAGVTGYQIVIAKNSKFTKGKRTFTADGSSKRMVIRSLKKGKIYYVKIRSYTKTFGRTIYSSWGDVRKVRAKKEIKVSKSKKSKKKSKKKN